MLEHRSPHLVLGAAKSGKSSYAESLIASLEPPYTYIATAQVLDDEMRERVSRHRERRDTSWSTIEAPLEVIAQLEALRGSGTPVLLDCLTLWLTNLLLSPDQMSPEREVDALCDLLPTLDYPLVIVANEVGGGIVPDNPLARRFRDLAGLAAQRVAARCNSVTLVVAGLPLKLK